MISQATAVVLNQDKSERDDIRARLADCGILPICFKDEWICLENIHHIKPLFAVLRTDASSSTSTFINVATAIDDNFPVIVLSRSDEATDGAPIHCPENLFPLRYPAEDQEFQDAIKRMIQPRQAAKGPILIAGSAARHRLIKTLPQLAASGEPLLIQGEAGVGKKLFARTIHRYATAGQPAIDPMDAGDLTGQWIRTTRHQLDERKPDDDSLKWVIIENIERVPFAIQSQLLLLLEDYQPGGTGIGKAGLRFITLTVSDLAESCRSGAFRKDLYHRLSVLKIDIPPLRRHASDVRALMEYFAAQYGIRFKGAVYRVPDDMMAAYTAYPWPGNVAELKQNIRQLMNGDGGDWKAALPVLCRCENTPVAVPSAFGDVDVRRIRRFLKDSGDISLRQATNWYAARIEKKIIKAVLAKTQGNCKKAASLLDISYKSMLNKAKAYELV